MSHRSFESNTFVQRKHDNKLNSYDLPRNTRASALRVYWTCLSDSDNIISHSSSLIYKEKSFYNFVDKQNIF